MLKRYKSEIYIIIEIKMQTKILHFFIIILKSKNFHSYSIKNLIINQHFLRVIIYIYNISLSNIYHSFFCKINKFPTLK
jgi:hypothetical protein